MTTPEPVASGGLIARLAAIAGWLRRARAAWKREILTFIKRTNTALIEAGLIDLQIGAVQRIRRQFLDRKTDRFRRGAESPVGEARPLLLANGGGKQFGSSVEAKGSHDQGPLFLL